MAARRTSRAALAGSNTVTLQKGDQIETPTTAARAVALRYDGFREVEKVSAKDVQQAKPAGSTTTTTN